MEQIKEAVYLINDERYLHLRENGAGVGFATYNKVTGEPLESGQISEKNLPPDGQNTISAARNWYLFELSDDDRKAIQQESVKILENIPQAGIGRRRIWEPETLPKDIRLINSHYDDLYRIPDGGVIQVDYPDGRSFTARVEHLDDYHFDMGGLGNVFHICQFAEVMERNHADFCPEIQTQDEQAAWELGGKGYLAIQSCEDGWDYTLYHSDYSVMDGGQLGAPELTIQEAREQILEAHHIRRRNVERSQYEYEQQERDLLDHRGLPAPEPDPASAEDPAGQVRQAAPDVPDEPSPGAVQHDAPEREPVPAPDGGGADGREPDAADHGAASETEPGPGQGAESDGMGAAHEQPESAGRGTGADGADLQLSFFDAHIPTEAEQIGKIDQAESEKLPSAFVLPQAEIENELREHGSGFMGGKQRIMALYQTQPDRNLRAKALAREYGIGGHSHDYLDGSRGFVNHDGKGMEFDHYPEHKKFTLSWTQVEKYIDLMIQSDRYLTDKEKEHRAAVQEAERQLPMLDGDAAAEYNALKEQYPNTLIGFELGGYFLFYDKDAITVKEVFRSNLLSQENALGKVKVTGFLRREWVAKSQKLWAEGNSIYLAGQGGDGTHHQTKYLREEDYLPIGIIVKLDGRDFRVDHVNFMFKSVSLQDMYKQGA